MAQLEKTCSKCLRVMPLESFGAHPRGKNGKQAKCYECYRDYHRKYRQWNPTAAYKASNEWKLKNPEQRRATNRSWRAKNAAKARAATRLWYRQHPEKNAEYARKRYERNPAKAIAVVRRKQAEKLRAIPAWANLFFIEEIYDLARLRTQYLGIKHHVDHIVPLRHPLVCGLHVEHNLRVVPASVNQMKGNRHWPDMPR